MMPRWLSRSIAFPDAGQATEEGLVAIGGDLSPARLIEAYRQGIFPWYSVGQPLLWWSPDPRAIISVEDFRLGRTLRKVLRRNLFEVTVNRAFDAVIEACADIHEEPGGSGWLTEEMVTAYKMMHRLGHAHSVEVWKGDQLAGGLYGVSFQGFFAGESMFHVVSNASKVGLAALVARMKERGMSLLDCQMATRATIPLGAVEISRAEYLRLLGKAWSLQVGF